MNRHVNIWKENVRNWCCSKSAKFAYFRLKGKFKGAKIKMDKAFKME